MTDAVAGYLKSRNLLLVDNCEHVIGAIAQLADILLRNCPISASLRPVVNRWPSRARRFFGFHL